MRKPDGYWTKEAILAEAEKYQTRSEWRKNSPSSYSASWKLGLLKNIQFIITET
jgi:hypothetical protein